MELERGGDHNHLEAGLEQILELIESTWPAGHVAPRVSEMVHQARTVLERSRSRSNERSKKRNTNGFGMAGDRYHVEKEEEHGAEAESKTTRRNGSRKCNGWPKRKT